MSRLWCCHLMIQKQLLIEERVAPLCLPFPLLSLKQKHMLPMLLLVIPAASIPPTSCQNLPLAILYSFKELLAWIHLLPLPQWGVWSASVWCPVPSLHLDSLPPLERRAEESKHQVDLESWVEHWVTLPLSLISLSVWIVDFFEEARSWSHSAARETMRISSEKPTVWRLIWKVET